MLKSVRINTVRDSRDLKIEDHAITEVVPLLSMDNPITEVV